VRWHHPPIVGHADPDSTTITGRTGNHRHGGRPLILGLGTGRCGTASLAKLLTQTGVDCTHQMRGYDAHRPIGWDEPERAARAATAILERPGDNDSTVADISPWWLPHIPYLRTLHPNMRTIALRRDADQCAASWQSHLTPQRNHWDATNRDPWTKSFPKFLGTENDIAAASRKYHDYYYRTCRELDIEIFETRDLNTDGGVRQILRHLDLRTNTTPKPGTRNNATVEPLLNQTSPALRTRRTRTRNRQPPQKTIPQRGSKTETGQRSRYISAL